MRRHDIAFLIDYNYWANARVLAAAARVPEGEFVAAQALTPRSLRGTLVHQLDVEWSWRLRWQGRGETEPLRDEDFMSVEQLAARWREDEAEMLAFLAGLDDADFERPWAPTGGQPLPLWQFILHVVNHGTQQRADAAVLLSVAGCSPGGLDVSDFVGTWLH